MFGVKKNRLSVDQMLELEESLKDSVLYKKYAGMNDNDLAKKFGLEVVYVDDKKETAKRKGTAMGLRIVSKSVLWAGILWGICVLLNHLQPEWFSSAIFKEMVLNDNWSIIILVFLVVLTISSGLRALADSTDRKQGKAEVDKALLTEEYQGKSDDLVIEEGVEAKLIRPIHPGYNGTILIRESLRYSTFAFTHELMHYVFDVGEGNEVTQAFTRKFKGEEKDENEQLIDYRAAANRMREEMMIEEINIYDNAVPEMNPVLFVSRLCKKYGVDRVSAIRRVQEVRAIMERTNRQSGLSQNAE